MFKYILFIAIGFIFCSFSGTTGCVTTTEFFYFELVPEKVVNPYYISQSFSIDFTDQPNLEKQRRAYIHKLKLLVIKNGDDTLLYRSFVPQGSYTKDRCEALRASALKAVNAAGRDIIYRDLE
ncbi:MAG TPA: hypothetical protein VK890_04520 [Bacteroidia bacterium]|jgi:hypothetical protein|nr:hypothetical protein [Bacteroidia bacterium]